MLVSLYPPEYVGGTECSTENLVKKLERTGKYKVDVITCKRKGFAKMLWYVIDGMKEIRKKEYDIIHCQSTFPALIPYLAKRKYFVYCRGSDVLLAKGWRKWLNKKVLGKAEKIVSLTKAMQNKIEEDYGLYSTIIPNAIELETLNKSTRLGNQVLFIGTLKKVKGIDYLLKSIALINARLIIIGDGPEKDNLMNEAKELNITHRVNFVGRLDSIQINDYISKSKVLVLPSLSEGFSTVLLEGMAGGLPIVATNVGGNPEIVQDGVNGYLVEPCDYEIMSRKINKLLQDNGLWEAFSNNNLIKVRTYTWQNVINSLEKIWFLKN